MKGCYGRWGVRWFLFVLIIDFEEIDNLYMLRGFLLRIIKYENIVEVDVFLVVYLEIENR